MAYLTLADAGNGFISWEIGGLSADISWYDEFGVTWSRFTVTSQTHPADNADISSSNSGSFYAGFGTFTLWGWASEGPNYFPVGSDTVTLSPPTPTRPPLWYWTNTPVQGEPFNITAPEWNELLEYVNDIREYKGISRVDFSNFRGVDNTASPGKSFYAYMYNNIKYTFHEEWGMRNDVSPGDTITAEHLLWLQDTLNSVS